MVYSIDAVTGAENWILTLALEQELSVREDSSTIVDHDGDILFTDENLGTICITQG
jgi:hypothetical protein